jgi:hypothetical protein
MTEKWVVIDRAPKFEVSNLGRFRKRSTGNILPIYTNRQGQATVILAQNWRHALTLNATMVVAAAFLGMRPPRMQTCHLDGSRLNIRASNLEYMSQSENIRHAQKLHLYPIQKWSVPFSWNEMKQIERMWADGLSQCEIGRRLKRNNSSISKYLKRNGLTGGVK